MVQMSSAFKPELFKRVSLEDRASLEPRLVAASPTSCEHNFANLFIWGFTYGTKWQDFDGRIYVHLEVDDELLFPPGVPAPSLEELSAVSDAMRGAGFGGAFRQVPESFIKSNPDLAAAFEAEQIPEDFGEYVYSTERLAQLPGSKLGRKRNLISQFKRANPVHRCVPLESSMLEACFALAGRWHEGKDRKLVEMDYESSSLRHAIDSYASLGLDGLAAFAGGSLVAFSMFSRVSPDVYTVHFEKADLEVKGAAQYINNETAKALLGRCAFINREQDLGVEGLRQAKRSYDPALHLRNYSLLRLD